MSFLYEVAERETNFLLWECECGHKLLERRPMDSKRPLPARGKSLALLGKLATAGKA